MAQTIDAPGPKQTVLFICSHNAARSQMAEALLKAKYGDRYEVFSAGVEPAKQIYPLAAKVMQEIGLDISRNRLKSVDEFIRPGVTYDYVVTVCDAAAKDCPYIPAKQQVHKPFADPTRYFGTDEERLANMRKMRDELAWWIEDFFR